MSRIPYLPAIHVGPGWLVTVLLLIVSLVLWVGAPDPASGSPVARAAATLLVPLMVLPMVIAHEVAHHLVARRAGLAPPELRLHLIGTPGTGHGTDASPRTQAAIALAGPLLSLGFAAVLGVGWTIATGDPSPTAALVAWVLGCGALANLVLGLVSLYPGRPLDGAELVHAIVRVRVTDPHRASAVVTQVGVVAGWTVMLGGLTVAVRADATAGLWLVLVGWLLVRASRIGQVQEQLMGLVDGYTVGDALSADVPVVTPGLTLDTLVDQARLGQGSGVYPVVRDGRLLGLIDVQSLRRLNLERRTSLRVSDRMEPVDRFTTVTPDQPLWDAVAYLERRRMAALPVVAADDRQRLLGVVSRTSVYELLQRRRRTSAPAADDVPTEAADLDGPDTEPPAVDDTDGAGQDDPRAGSGS
ncbi:MAG: CBS domain-containing protein [Chloroflexi bacterium]|nr:CBS domain-containing protein [Chloroflexota bacterium]